jgi:hypothetical protein
MSINKKTLIVTSNIYGLSTRLKGGKFMTKDSMLNKLKIYLEKGKKYNNKSLLFKPVTNFLRGGNLSENNRINTIKLMNEWLTINFKKRTNDFKNRIKNKNKNLINDNSNYINLLEKTIYKGNKFSDNKNLKINNIITKLESINVEDYKKNYK